MSDAKNDIQMAQVEAGERVVIERLRAKGLLSPEQALEALPDNPTEEEAEAVLQACGTSGKEVVNDFIERLLRENLELKRKLAAPSVPADARSAAEEVVRLIQDEYEHGAASIEPKIVAIISRHFPSPASAADARELVDEVQERMDKVVEAAVEWHQAGREGVEWFDKAEALEAAVDSLLELRSAPGECFCGTELEAGLCPNGHDPIMPRASAPSPSALLDARKVAFDWAIDRELYGISNDEIQVLAQRITTFATNHGEERYRAAVEAAAKVAEDEGTSCYRKQQQLSASAPTSSLLVLQAEQDTADILAKRIRALFDKEKKDAA